MASAAPTGRGRLVRWRPPLHTGGLPPSTGCPSVWAGPGDRLGQQFWASQGQTGKNLAPPTWVSWSPEQSRMKSSCCEVTLLGAAKCGGGGRAQRCRGPARSCYSCASLGAGHTTNLGEKHPAGPSQPTEPCETLPPPPLKTSAKVSWLYPKGLQSEA